jgi:hypothetical protein
MAAACGERLAISLTKLDLRNACCHFLKIIGTQRRTCEGKNCACEVFVTLAEARGMNAAIQTTKIERFATG